jgi:hypothetical protein
VGIRRGGNSSLERFHSHGLGSIEHPNQGKFCWGNLLVAMVADSPPRSKIDVLDVGGKGFECFPNVVSALAIAQGLQLECGVQKPGAISLVSDDPEL